jgi:hypothetical protein
LRASIRAKPARSPGTSAPRSISCIVTSDRHLAAYLERCTARPAFKRAFDAQMADFKLAA